MNEIINIRKALRAFNKIVTDGQRVEDEYHLNGLIAYTDFDGYIVTIRSDYVYLDIFFHNKYTFKFSNQKEKLLFLEKINSLDKEC